MYRPLPERFIALGLSIAVFLAMAGEGLGYRRACPHHEDTAAPAADAHAGMAAHAEAPHGAPEHGEHPCSCLGGCTPAAGFALPSTAQIATPGTGSAESPLVAHRDDAREPRVAFLLPFANAPPGA